MRTRLIGAAIASAGLVLATAEAAVAVTTTVSLGGGGYEVRVSGESGTLGNVNSVTVEEDASGNVLVTDSAPGVSVVAGANCSQQTSTRVSCPPDPTSTASLQVTTGEGNDNIAISLPARPLAGIVSIRAFGGPGADFLRGGPGAEMLDGDGQLGNGTPFVTDPTGGPQEGNDIIQGEGGADNVLGRGGRDYLNGAGPSGADTAANVLEGGAGSDFLDVGGMLGSDILLGGSGDDAAVSEATASAILFGGVTLTNGEKAQVFGGDTVSYGTRTYTVAGSAGVVADLDGVRDDGATGENDQIGSDVEALVGTIRDDRLTGTSGANRIEGRLGVDTLAGLDGPDRIRFREGIADKCYVPGTGDSVDLDLTDPPATLCTPKSLPLSFTTTLNASPADETMPYVKVGKRVRRRGARRVVATVRCARKAQKTCKGRVTLTRRLGSKALARRRFRAKPGRTARVVLRASAARVRALKRSRRVVLRSVHQGLSKIGPSTTIVARRF
jgi:hypothetical protein